MAAIGPEARVVVRAAAFAFSLLILVMPAALAGATANSVATMLAQVNALRSKLGLAALTPDARLMRAAQRQSEELARLGALTHEPPSGDLSARVGRMGYRFGLVEENLALGMVDPTKVLRAWLRSPGHRANLLRAEVSRIGIGYAPRGGRLGHYWTLIMADPAI
jgi:uncharacterized protein YkwD